MATIQEIQAQKAAFKSAQQAGAIAGKATTTSPPVSSNIATGLQGSTAQAISASAFQLPPAVVEIDEELAASSKGVYEATYLKKFFRPDGAVAHSAINGFFYAKDEIDIKELEHFAVMGKVTKVELKKQEEKK